MAESSSSKAAHTIDSRRFSVEQTSLPPQSSNLI
jgi:hypothetical protein